MARRPSPKLVAGRRVRGLGAATEAGRRVFLRPPTRRDEGEVLALRRESWSFLRPWEPLPPDGVDPCGPAWFRAFVRAHGRPGTDRSLVCRRADGAVLGVISLSQIVRGAFQSAYLGYWVGAPHAGRGTMSDGLQLVLRRTFRELGLHRVEANLRPTNDASRKLVERAGFTREGYSRRYLKIAGRWHDHERWALLREDWRPRRV